MDVAEQLHELWSRYADEVPRPRRCLYCTSRRVHWNGRWTRTATVLCEGEVVFVPPFPIRRVRCAACRRSWGLRPPCLVPHRHYQLCVIAEAEQRWLFDPGASLGAIATALCCSPRSVRRWRRWLAGLAEPARLLSLLAAAAREPVVPRLVEVAARKAADAVHLRLLRRAGHVLCLLEALASALGLEPPGLRGVLLAVIGDRTGLSTDASPSIPEDAWRRLPGPSGSLIM